MGGWSQAHPDRPAVGLGGHARRERGTGRWRRTGGIFNFGDRSFFGSMGGKPLNRAIRAAWRRHPTVRGTGRWPSDGGIFSFGATAPFLEFDGSARRSTQPFWTWRQSASTMPTGTWVPVASDGGALQLRSDALVSRFDGWAGSLDRSRCVDMVGQRLDMATGYWEVASDGGIFSFGAGPVSRRFHGGPGDRPTVPRSCGMAARLLSSEAGRAGLGRLDGGIPELRRTPMYAGSVHAEQLAPPSRASGRCHGPPWDRSGCPTRSAWAARALELRRHLDRCRA